MKYLKLFENFQSEDEIRKICNKYGIKNYTINNGLVDVDGSVDLERKQLTKLPLKFGNITGYFSCKYNQITSLEGGPHTVNHFFSCGGNELTSLEGGPHTVNGHFYCAENKLTSLVGGPTYVSGDYHCAENELTNLIGSPQSVNNFNCYRNNLTSLEGAPKEIKNELSVWGNKGIFSLKGLEETKLNKLLSIITPFSEISNRFSEWNQVAMYEYFYWDFLFEKDGVWCCDLDNLNSFLMVMTDVYKIPYQEVTRLQNYKCV